MNGVGVGVSVGLGALIGLLLVAPDVSLVEYLTTTVFFHVFGFSLFEGVRMLFFWKPPNAHPPRT
jgi:hypothetical protein